MALNDNRLDVAERALKSHLSDDPYDVYAIRMLAELAGRIGRWQDAEHLLRRAVELAPGWAVARANLALVLGRTGSAAEAMQLLDDLVAEQPDLDGFSSLRAATHGRLGDFDEAIRLYEEVLERVPNQPRVLLSYGHILKTVGRQADGIAAYRKAIACNPKLGEAWWSLANLKTVKFQANDLAAMDEVLRTPDLGEEDRMHLEFALAKALHDSGHFDQAFDHYARANASRLKVLPYQPELIAKVVDRSIEAFTADAFAARAGGCDGYDPIFIVGMPRAGSTLIEQILSSHSLVEGTAELPDIPMLSRQLGSYPEEILKASSDERRAIGEDYLRRTGVQRRTKRPYFIDKLPNNWLFVPFIQLILPNAKIIDARRHPFGCCLSNFRQHFARGQDFTYDLEHVGRYYADYARLMAHVETVLPGHVHRVIYERMVEDTETEVRRLFDYCGLEFEPQVLEFYKTDRAIRTASSEQVRQPIYREATDEWRAYAAHLAPLRHALGAIAETYADGLPADNRCQ